MATIDSGPPGIEVEHEWNGEISLNVFDDDPRYRVRRITGLHSLPEADDNRSPNTSQRGEHLLPSYVRGKTVVYEGEIQARSLDDLAQARQALRGAFRGRNEEGTMVLNGDPAWFYKARVMQLDIDDEQLRDGAVNKPFMRPFTLGMRMSDARFYTPLTSPPSVGAAAGVSAVATNLGTADTDPVFSITPTSDVLYLQNLDLPNDPGLVFQDMDIGRAFTIHFLERAANYDDDGSDVLANLDPSGSFGWWDELVPGMIPGANELKVTGGTWTATWHHASE